jgi:hypothetical protein
MSQHITKNSTSLGDLAGLNRTQQPFKDNMAGSNKEATSMVGTRGCTVHGQQRTKLVLRTYPGRHYPSKTVQCFHASTLYSTMHRLLSEHWQRGNEWTSSRACKTPPKSGIVRTIYTAISIIEMQHTEADSNRETVRGGDEEDVRRCRGYNNGSMPSPRVIE